MVKNPPANAGDIRNEGSIPGLGRSPGEGSGNPLQYSCLENPMDRGAWQAVVHGSTHHVLASANSAALNIGVHASFQIRIFSGYMLRSGIAGSYGSSVFSFFKKPSCFLHSGCTQFTFPPSVGELTFLHTLSSIYCL